MFCKAAVQVQLCGGRIRAYPIIRRAQIAPSDFSSGEADFPQQSFVDFKGKRRSMTEKAQASCVRIISG